MGSRRQLLPPNQEVGLIRVCDGMVCQKEPDKLGALRSLGGTPYRTRKQAETLGSQWTEERMPKTPGKIVSIKPYELFVCLFKFRTRGHEVTEVNYLLGKSLDALAGALFYLTSIERLCTLPQTPTCCREPHSWPGQTLSVGPRCHLLFVSSSCCSRYFMGKTGTAESTQFGLLFIYLFRYCMFSQCR